MPIANDTRVAPHLRDAEGIRAKAMAGDMVFSALPATPGSSVAAVIAAVASTPLGNKYLTYVECTLKTAAGEIHEWFSGSVPVTISDDASGAAAMNDGENHVHFVNGRAVACIKYTGTWAEGKVRTFTISAMAILGTTVGAATSIDTLIA